MSEQRLVIPYNLTLYKKRLLALADHIDKLPQKLFHMQWYRDYNGTYRETLEYCDTLGCILGHATTVLRKQFKVKIPLLPYSGGRIDFDSLSSRFGFHIGSPGWKYLFDSLWYNTDNTPTGAAQRIRWVVEHDGIPDNWWEQISGQSPLSYKDEI